MRADFYETVISKAGIETDDTVLAVCAGKYDMQTLLNAGVSKAVISNLDFHDGHSQYEPYEWSRQDAEGLTFNDDEFDWVVVHAGLHHCGSPHGAMCEMLRVARKGIVVIESRDSVLMRAAVSMGLTAEYELEPAALSGGKSGGHRNSAIPNFVYRWTEREVDKTVRSFLPQRKPTVEFYYQYRVPLQRMTMSRNPVKKAIAWVGEAMVGVIELILPKQGNLFGFVVRKRGELQPWLSENQDTVDVNLSYIYKIYDPKKYQKNFQR